MFRRVLPLLLVFLLLLIDVTILPLIVQRDWIPLISLLSVHCLGLLLGRTRGLWYGLLSGILFDVLVSTPFGLQTVLFALSGYFGGVFGRALTRHPLTPILSSAACMLAYELILYLYLSFSTLTFTLDYATTALMRVGMEVLGVQVLYYFYDWILKPSHSRFARR